MSTSLSFYVVDDDQDVNDLTTALLEAEGFHVRSNTSSVAALEEITADPPDCVITDIMMPGMDGLEMCRHLRAEKALHDTAIIMLTAKSYSFDQRRAYQFGANGYFNKPIDPSSFIEQVRRIISDQIEVCFWGVRGTLPVPGPDSVHYGGNTSCVSLSFSRERKFIFDAGTGIKALGDHLVENKGEGINARIFISHAHWDHINAMPFFAPLYIAGNSFEICGPSQGDLTMQDLISAQMDNVYFPITIKEFAASVTFRDLRERSYEFDDIEIRTMLLKHPGYCLGYRINHNGRSVCYVTDNELYPQESQYHDVSYVEKLTEFVRSCDMLITDTTFFDNDYPDKIGWGHSSLGQVVQLAHNAGVKTLYLFHHDPDQKDFDIDRKQAEAERLLQALNSATQCIAPRERLVVNV